MRSRPARARRQYREGKYPSSCADSPLIPAAFGETRRYLRGGSSAVSLYQTGLQPVTLSSWNHKDNIAISRCHASVWCVCEGGGSSLRGGHPHRHSVRKEAACGALVSTVWIVWIVCFSVHLRRRCQPHGLCSVGWQVRCEAETNWPQSNFS
jgi:hypothetical protein